MNGFLQSDYQIKGEGANEEEGLGKKEREMPHKLKNSFPTHWKIMATS